VVGSEVGSEGAPRREFKLDDEGWRMFAKIR